MSNSRNQEISTRTDAAAVARTGTVESEQRCTRCGYILRGLSVAGKCPECGLDVVLSIGEYDLASATPAWLRRMRRGLRLLLTAAYLAGLGVAALLVAALATFAQMVSQPSPIFFLMVISPMLLAMLAPLPGMAGVLFIAAPNPAEPENNNVRREARLALVWLGLCLIGVLCTACATAMSAYIAPVVVAWIGGLAVFLGIGLLIISSARIAASIMGPGATSVRKKLALTVKRSLIAIIITPLWQVCSDWLPVRTTGRPESLLDAAATMLGCIGALLVFAVMYYIPAALISYAGLLREVLSAVKAAIKEQERRRAVSTNGDA
ncbi:MAG: hypothetical protein JXO22_04775 [Phycisphaerae bacterium]|nr:hypothetical protein [Phycisphaerae bacterium]